jgi:hypothetical protein
MRFHLVNVEDAQQHGEMWTIAPPVPLQSLPSSMMMPMAGEEVELHFPDGSVVPALIASFGVDVWRDGEGNFYTNSDLSDPSLTLSVTCPSDIGEIPPGTEEWLTNATYASAPESS